MRNLSSLTNEELILSLKSLVGDERGGLVSILKHLSEFERRQLAEKKSYPSLFDYCVRELRYAQGEAFRRIRAARAADKYRVIYPMIERGALNLTTVALLEPHLKWENYRRLIRASIGLGAREVEALVASLYPVAAAPVERVRILTVAVPAPPVQTEDLFAAAVPGPTRIAAAPPPAVAVSTAPIAAIVPAAQTVRRVHFSFTGDETLLRDVERAKELSRHKWPAGKLEDVFAGAVKALLEKIDPDKRRRRRERVRKLAAGARSRKIPAAIREEVWNRDGGRCVYATGGRVCGARAGLEFDHVRPWALGGSSDAANLRLLCRTHNDLEARRAFGASVIDAAVARRRGALRRGVKI